MKTSNEKEGAPNHSLILYAKAPSWKYSSNLYEKPFVSFALISPETINKLPTNNLETTAINRSPLNKKSNTIVATAVNIPAAINTKLKASK